MPKNNGSEKESEDSNTQLAERSGKIKIKLTKRRKSEQATKTKRTEAPLSLDVIWTRAAANDYIHDLQISISINWLIVWFIICHKIVKNVSPRKCLQRSCFVRPTVKSPQLFSLQLYKQEKESLKNTHWFPKCLIYLQFKKIIWSTNLGSHSMNLLVASW